MENLDKAKKILQKASTIEKVGSVALAKEFIELNEKIDSIPEKIDLISEELKQELKKKSELVLEIDREEIKGDKGEDGKDGIDGKDYILTDKDKKEIASSIKVPIVEKVIEKTEVIKEPIITNEIKEVAISDTGEEIVSKINDLEIKPELQIDAKHIKNLPEFKGGRYYGGSGIKEIIAGSNVTVDNTNLGYPVISSTGGGTPGGSLNSVQFNNGGTFDGFGSWDGTSLDLGTGKFLKTNGIYDSGGSTNLIDLFNKTINDISSVPALVWDARKLYDGSGNQNLEWYNAGQIRIGNTNGGIFDTSLLTANHTYLTPDSDGTLALLSDIPSLSGYVNTSGTPANNQLAIFTDVDTIEGDSNFTWDGSTFGVTGRQTISQGTITTDLKALDISSTWNASGVNFTALKLNVTNTASGASSYLADLQVGGNSKFWVDKSGFVNTPFIKVWRNGGTGTAAEFYNNTSVTGMTAGMYFTTDNGAGAAGGVIQFFSGSQGLTINPNSGISTDFTVVYGGNRSYFSLASNFDVYGGTGIPLKLGAGNTKGYLQINTSGLVQLHGTTSSFPALKRSSANLEVRLADDSAYTAVQSLYQRFGSGSPEGVVTAPVGAIYSRTDGGAGTSLYVKESGTGNTGWVAK